MIGYSVLWWGGQGTSAGGTPTTTTPIACFDAYGTIAAQELTGAIPENTIVVTLAPEEFQGTITVEPAIGDIETPIFEGRTDC